MATFRLKVGELKATSLTSNGGALVMPQTSGINTDHLTEGTTNIFHTNARADARISNAVGVTVCDLSSGVIPLIRYSASDVVLVSTKDANSGVCGLDSSAKVAISKLAQAPELTANKNVANGYAGLDGSAKLPASYLDQAYEPLSSRITFSTTVTTTDATPSDYTVVSAVPAKTGYLMKVYVVGACSATGPSYGVASFELTCAYASNNAGTPLLAIAGADQLATFDSTGQGITVASLGAGTASLKVRLTGATGITIKWRVYGFYLSNASD